MAPRGGMQKSQQQARIALHRTRDIDQNQQRQRLLAPLQARQPKQLATRAGGLVHHARPVHARARGGGAGAACREMRQGQFDVARQPFDQSVFGGRQRVEVGVLKALDVAGRHGRVKLDLPVFGARLSLLPKGFLRRQGFAHTRAALAGLGFAC